MAWIGLIILVVIIVYGVVRLRALEREIRAEQTANTPTPSTSHDSHNPHDSRKESDESLQIRMLRLVMQQPGILQTEVYEQIPQHERREIQELLRELDQQKLLRREKQGNSYALYPV